MATWDDVHELAAAMPGAVEDSRGDAWKTGVAKAAKSFVWDRPLRAKDLEETGPQTGPIIGIRVADEGEKLAVIASDEDVFFTTHHFDGYNAVLLHRDRISRERLAEVIADSWIAVASKRAVQTYLGAGGAPQVP